ncbi:MAG: chemotaxis protein CheW [Rhizobiales bacterium]|nr:chemotaxis protein CheW [Hyphomicrobiales bacterium]
MDNEKAHDRHELIAFKVGDQEFCVDIMNVREIRGWTATTPIPHAPPYVVGVINLRGTVLPVLDLAGRLGKDAVTPSHRHAIIVVQDEGRMTGLLVEAVSDIVTVGDEMIHPTPEVSDNDGSMFITGIVTLEGRMISLLSLAAVLPARQIKAA